MTMGDLQSTEADMALPNPLQWIEGHMADYLEAKMVREAPTTEGLKETKSSMTSIKTYLRRTCTTFLGSKMT